MELRFAHTRGSAGPNGLSVKDDSHIIDRKLAVPLKPGSGARQAPLTSGELYALELPFHNYKEIGLYILPLRVTPSFFILL